MELHTPYRRSEDSGDFTGFLIREQQAFGI